MTLRAVERVDANGRGTMHLTTNGRLTVCGLPIVATRAETGAPTCKRCERISSELPPQHR